MLPLASQRSAGGFKLAIAFLFLTTITVAAQTSAPQARLSGVIQDQTGAVVPDAKVEVSAGSYKAFRRSSGQGIFEFASVPMARALITINAAGFAPYAQELEVDGDTRLSIELLPAVRSDEILVTASRTPEPADQIADQIVVQSRGELASTAAPTLDDALRQVPGFTLFRRSGSRTANPTSQGVSLRGVGASGASRAVVVRDGVPINDPFGAWVYWGRVPRESIESVEVLSGGASHLYGSDALGGVINVIPTRPASHSLALETFMGAQTSPDVSLQASVGLGRWTASLSGEVFATKGYIAVAPSDRGLADTPVASRRGSAMVSLDRQFTDGGRMFASGSFYRESRNNGTPLQVNETELFELIAGIDREIEAGRLAVRLYGSGQTFLQDFSAIAPGRGSESLTRQQHVPAQQLGGTVQWSGTLGTVHALGAGVDMRQVRGFSDELIFAAGSPTADTAAGGRQRTIGFFLRDSIQLHPRWTLSATGRFDFWQNYDAFSARVPIGPGATTFTGFPDRSEQSFSPRLSLLYRASERLAFTASGYRAFRAPTLNELYRAFRVGNILTQANENLRAEHLAGGEGGVRISAGRARISSVFFWTIVTGAIANRTLDVTSVLITRQRQNLGRTQSRGLDITADLPLTRTFSLSGGYQFADATILRFVPDPALEGRLLPQTPKHSFTFQARYSQPSGWTLALETRASGQQFEDDLNALALDGFATFDAFVSRRLNRNIELFAAGENLLNRRYQIGRTPVLMLGPPILGRFGLRVRLGDR